MVSAKRESGRLDIACDITPDRDNKDPLANLDEIEFESEQEGPLEEIFLETQLEDSDMSDPMAHLEFSLDKDDDHLIRSETSEIQKAPSIEKSTRQLVDDSLNVYSEFDAPSLIPEDWMSGDETRTVEKSIAKEPILKESNDRTIAQPASTKLSTQEWEEVAPSQQTTEIEAAVPSDTVNIIDAFRKGLGISDDSLLKEDPRLFEQMGMCLRLV